MSEIELERGGRLAYRRGSGERGTELPTLLMVHGFPESSYMWRGLMEEMGSRGFNSVAPDLLGYGDSPADPPAGWERQVEALGELVTELELERVVPIVHDWGGLIGLWWACEHPDLVAGLVISDTGFFADGRWHGMAEGFRTPGTGEEMVEGIDRDGLAGLLRSSGSGFTDEAVEEYYKAFETAERRAGILELYRSGDMEKLARFDGALAEMAVPTLLLWGEDDPFAPVAGAERFREELPDAELVTVEDAGHFVYEDDPEQCAEVVGEWLERRFG